MSFAVRILHMEKFRKDDVIPKRKDVVIANKTAVLMQISVDKAELLII